MVIFKKVVVGALAIGFMLLGQAMYLEKNQVLFLNNTLLIMIEWVLSFFYKGLLS